MDPIQLIEFEWLIDYHCPMEPFVAAMVTGHVRDFERQDIREHFSACKACKKNFENWQKEYKQHGTVSIDPELWQSIFF